MNEATIKAAFEEWWRDSYGVPPGTHAVMTHTAFAAYLLTLLELMENSQPTSNDRQIRSSLVTRVHSCIVGEPECGHMQARATIREVAKALQQSGHCSASAWLLKGANE
jgi:hypothetical protein